MFFRMADWTANYEPITYTGASIFYGNAYPIVSLKDGEYRYNKCKPSLMARLAT